MFMPIKFFRSQNPEQITLPILDDFQNTEAQFIDDVPQEFSKGLQYVGFKLHDHEFLLIMASVREIVMLSRITYVPRANSLVEGVIALRGEIMPVINLKKFLKFPKSAAKSTTRIIILECEHGGFGLLVDDITQFVSLSAAEIEMIPPNFFPSEYRILSGLSKLGRQIRGIIDVKAIVSEIMNNIRVEVEDEI